MLLWSLGSTGVRELQQASQAAAQAPRKAALWWCRQGVGWRKWTPVSYMCLCSVASSLLSPTTIVLHLVACSDTTSLFRVCVCDYHGTTCLPCLLMLLLIMLRFLHSLHAAEAFFLPPRDVRVRMFARC